MPVSRATAAWVVSGALGLSTIAVVAALRDDDIAPATPRPAVIVTISPTPTVSPALTVGPSPPGSRWPAPGHSVKPFPSDSVGETALTGPSPVTPPSAQTAD